MVKNGPDLLGAVLEVRSVDEDLPLKRDVALRDSIEGSEAAEVVHDAVELGSLLRG